MKVREAMQMEVRTARMDGNLQDVARTMSQVGCGVLPVVDDNLRLAGVVTDRDVCLVLADENRKPTKIHVDTVMHQDPFFCRADDDVRDALAMMSRHHVRRLPVVTGERRVEGILSLDDLVLKAKPLQEEGFTGPLFADIVDTLQAICERQTRVAA